MDGEAVLQSTSFSSLLVIAAVYLSRLSQLQLLLLLPASTQCWLLVTRRPNPAMQALWFWVHQPPTCNHCGAVLGGQRMPCWHSVQVGGFIGAREGLWSPGLRLQAGARVKYWLGTLSALVSDAL
jgi:hypothetical protein